MPEADDTPEVGLVRIDKLSFDRLLQPRASSVPGIPFLDEETVLDYCRKFRAGKKPPPIRAVLDPEGKIWPWDGWHRIEMHKRCKVYLIEVVLTPGTLDDARWLAAGANADHALSRRPEDKRRAVEIALKLRPESSDPAIAEHCSVDPKTVKKVRLSLGLPVDEPRVGRDGKCYRPKTPTAAGATSTSGSGSPVSSSEPATSGNGRPESAPLRHPEPMRDLVGMTVPPHLEATFMLLSDFNELDRILADCQRFAGELAKRPGGERYRQNLALRGNDYKERHYCECLADARRKIRSHQPFAARCPYCHHEGGVRPGCRCCLGLGWCNEPSWEAAPAEYRKAALEDHGAPV